jgi:uncharacterized membrane protein YecN with MAPEG domain
MEITIFTASILSLFYVFLAMRIGYFRGSPVMKLIFQRETKGSPEILERNVRAHGNFIEYVPLFLILLMLSEGNGSLDDYWLKIFTIIFGVGRFNHAICFAFFTHNPFLRISGMLLTYTGIIALAVSLLIFVI